MRATTGGAAARAVKLLRSPARFFLLVGGVAGALCCFFVPSFAGIDEGEHFARAYSISRGQLLPAAAPAGATGVGACLPEDVEATIVTDRTLYYFGTRPSANDARQGTACVTRSGAPGLFVDLSSFSWYAPLGYLPQAVGIAAGSAAGADVTVMLTLARLAALAVYLALASAAIRITPTARWTMAVIALLPIAVLEGSSSLSPDSFATALGLVVVALALRLVGSEPGDAPWRALVAGAAVAGVALGLTKPTYVLITLAYLLPLLARRTERGGRRVAWEPAAAAALALATSFVWHRWRQRDFVCDVRFFGVRADPSEQIHAMITRPHELVWGMTEGFVANIGAWLHRVVVPGEQVAPDWVVPWGLAGSILALVVLALVAVQRDPGESLRLARRHRVALGAIFVLGMVALAAGWYAYCSPTGFDLVSVPHVRLFVPFLVLPAVALVPTGPRAQRLAATAVPVSVGVVLVWVGLLVHLGLRPHY